MTSEMGEDAADLPDGFRMTELGPLPEEWQVVRLGEVVVRAFGGGTPSTKNPAFWNGSIPWTTSAIIGEDDIELQRFQRTITFEGLESSAASVAPKGSLLVGTRVGVGKAAVATFDVAINQDLTALILQDQANPYFLAYLLKTNRHRTWFEYNKRGSTIKGIPRQDLLRIQIPLPPLAEQRAIARVLRTVQRAQEAAERVIAALRELKGSLMRHLFTYGPVPLDEAGRVPLRETEIGPLPEHWQVVRLGEVAETTSGGTPKRDVPEYYGGWVPWIKSGELKDGYIYGADEYITEAGLRNSNAKIFQPGTLLIAMYGATAGKVGILQIAAATNQAICAVLPKYPNIISESFLFYVFIYLRDILLAQRYGGAQPNLSQTVIRSLSIPLPPLAEQHEIARILRAVDEKIQAEQARLGALRELFRTLLHELMTGRRRVPVHLLDEVQIEGAQMRVHDRGGVG